MVLALRKARRVYGVKGGRTLLSIIIGQINIDEMLP